MNVRNIIGGAIIASLIHTPTKSEVIKTTISGIHNFSNSLEMTQQDVKVDVAVILRDLERVVTFTVPEKNINKGREGIRCKETPDGGKIYEVNGNLYNIITGNFEKDTINLEESKDTKRTYVSTNGTTQICEDYDDVCVVNAEELKERIHALLEFPICKK